MDCKAIRPEALAWSLELGVQTGVRLDAGCPQAQEVQLWTGQLAPFTMGGGSCERLSWMPLTASSLRLEKCFCPDRDQVWVAHPASPVSVSFIGHTYRAWHVVLMVVTATPFLATLCLCT